MIPFFTFHFFGRRICEYGKKNTNNKTRLRKEGFTPEPLSQFLVHFPSTFFFILCYFHFPSTSFFILCHFHFPSTSFFILYHFHFPSTSFFILSHFHFPSTYFFILSHFHFPSTYFFILSHFHFTSTSFFILCHFPSTSFFIIYHIHLSSLYVKSISISLPLSISQTVFLYSIYLITFSVTIAVVTMFFVIQRVASGWVPGIGNIDN